MKSKGPATNATGAWTQKISLWKNFELEQQTSCNATWGNHTHPQVGVNRPARTAPDATPVVNPQLMSPINNPRRLELDRSSAKMMAVLISPALPHPAIIRPRMKTAKVGATAVIKRPIERMTLEKIT